MLEFQSFLETQLSKNKLSFGLNELRKYDKDDTKSFDVTQSSILQKNIDMFAPILQTRIDQFNNLTNNNCLDLTKDILAKLGDISEVRFNKYISEYDQSVLLSVLYSVTKLSENTLRCKQFQNELLHADLDAEQNIMNFTEILKTDVFPNLNVLGFECILNDKSYDLLSVGPWNPQHGPNQNKLSLKEQSLSLQQMRDALNLSIIKTENIFDNVEMISVSLLKPMDYYNLVQYSRIFRVNYNELIQGIEGVFFGCDKLLLDLQRI